MGQQVSLAEGYQRYTCTFRQNTMCRFKTEQSSKAEFRLHTLDEHRDWFIDSERYEDCFHVNFSAKWLENDVEPVSAFDEFTVDELSAMHIQSVRSD